MKSLLILFISLISLSAFGAEPTEVTSQIRDVTVFLRGAQITRNAVINLQKGNTTLAVRELPVNIDPQSIQARGEGNFIILSIVHQVNYLAGQRKTAQVKMLEDSIKIYEDQLASITGMLSILKNEKELLDANREIGSTEKGVNLAELKQMADFYRSRLTEIKNQEIRLNRESLLVKEKTDRLRNQLNSLNVKLKQPTSEVLVMVSSDQNISGRLELSYMVYEAGWMPVYDVRARDIQSPVELFYNAKVYQNTGESWDKVHIKLSTANPQQRGEKPDLQPWYLDFEGPVYPLSQYNAIPERESRKTMELMVEDAEVPAAAIEMGVQAETASNYTQVDDNQTNLEFNITIPYDIPSDNKQYTINIQDFTLPAQYEYYCAPKLDREAFLLARITGWENYNLLSGEISLFFEGTYVGKSYLNVRNTKDTLDLSLGRDKSIVVTRVKVKDFTEVRTIGSNKRETRAWDITVRNNKKLAVDLRLEDQLPVSMNKDLEIEPIEYSGGKYNKETGLITWKQRIEPSMEKKLRVSFAVKYPKDKEIFID